MCVNRVQTIFPGLFARTEHPTPKKVPLENSPEKFLSLSAMQLIVTADALHVQNVNIR